MIDVHCHLDDEAFKHDLDEVIMRAKNNGIKAIITSAINPHNIEYSLHIVRKFKDYVFLSVGLDPVVLDDEVFNEVYEWVKRNINMIVGIGEVGLDYYYIRDHNERSKQRDIFIKWIELARTTGKPLIVHSRSAGKYAIQVILEQGYYNVVMHAYDGSVGYAMEAAKKGIYFSIPPSVWFSQQKQKLVKRLPLEALLLESDAPVLAPFRDQRNEPANIVYAAKKIAELKGTTIDKVVDVTMSNTLEIFKDLKIRV